ncbi:Gfo/Idh/MocA family protein [Actinokineospora bangkokensis]|uniref:GFO/IDH/MocA-like oxidoreductase domain-containing protein n=1 Tax=Actinokineospora bangkokensis TaxID=1193682 RepID=A0A1Q9LGC3_9PSEU|nr:hypothetical protein [Actinokineospora bangkokensis]OLR91097.1 hypothetical protein BJP25_31705 [Actinokineospora bangkokensis]
MAERGPWAGANARWLSGALLGGPYSTSRWRHGGGALADVGPHVVDLLDAALGAVVDVPVAHHAEPDLWNVVLAHDSGATSALTLSMRMPLRPTVTEVDVYGDGGRLVLSGRATRADQCYALLLDDFTGMVRAGRVRHALDAGRGLRVQRTLDRVGAALAAV